MTPEEEFRQKVIRGYTKQPKLLLSRLVCRLFWKIGEPDYLSFVKEFVYDTTSIVGEDNIENVCDAIAGLILRNRKDVTDDTGETG